jgi:hypothetical protein
MSSHIGIAFFTADGFPVQWVIVLSSSEDSSKPFNGPVWCGTLIESVNGRVESWRHCEQGLTTFSPDLLIFGVVTVGKVGLPARDIRGSIFNRAWTAQDSRNSNDGSKYPPTDAYVRRVLFYLCDIKTISLPARVKNNFSGHIAGLLSRIGECRMSRVVTTCPVIPIA